ncbi:cystathionine beta-synthase [Micrococcoides hystricis]|uniref:Cystathionine beta-synthase n=1 Tax=Micrococcoides hystricis TaxID=1572761 RepID=A0ABV6P978_9MICC
MKYADSVLDLIGHTPLVKLNKVTEGIDATVLVKLEYLNPGGSIKDRIALKMIERAEAEGKLSPGGTVVEPTSGNTGVGLAMVAQQKGYKTVFVTPDKVGQEKRDVLRAYGADVVVVASAVAPDSEYSYYGVSDRLTRETEGAYKPDQFANPAAPDSHYETTGPEIWADTDGKITHFVAGAGTGGTITGTGRYLKEVSKDRPEGPVKVVVSDPDGSVYSGGTGRPYFVEGVGEDMWPGNYDPAVPDEVQPVTDAEAFEMTRRLAQEEGLLLGGSSGMAVVTALKVAKDLPKDAVVVVLAPDSGRGYLAKIFNDQWMNAHGFPTSGGSAETTAFPPAVGGATTAAEPTETANQTKQILGTTTVKELLETRAADKASTTPALLYVSPESSLQTAAQIMLRYGVDQLPVLAETDETPRAGEIRGSITSEVVTAALLTQAGGDEPVAAHIQAPLVTVGAHQQLVDVYTTIANQGPAVVLDAGAVAGVITAHDLLALAGN